MARPHQPSTPESSETVEGRPISRRDAGVLLGAGLLGSMLSPVVTPGAAAAAPATDQQGWDQQGCEQWTYLPTDVAADFLAQALRKSERARAYHQHFAGQGFQFVPARVQLAIRLVPGRRGERPVASLLAIAPSFKAFGQDAPGHTAASIMIGEHAGTLSVLATTVQVSHRPYRIESFGLVEISREGGVSQRTLSRDEIARMDVDDAARRLAGQDSARPLPRRRLPAPDGPSLVITGDVFRKLINDSHAAPLYPRGAIEAILADIPLAARFYQVVQARYEGNRYGGTGGPVGSFYCSCTCCNGCTTCSWGGDILSAAARAQ